MGNKVTIPMGLLLPQSVRVVNTDGKALMYSACHVVTVGDVLRSHPQHCLTEADQERKFSREVMLRDEEVLKPGSTYLILPLPRICNVASRRRPRRPSISSCWFCIATGGFSVPDSLSDDSNNDHCCRRDVGPPASLMAMEKSLAESNYITPKKTTRSPSRSPSAPALDLQKLLDSAGIEWNEITDLSRTWKPDLESIKEESMKLLPPRQCLAELIESETFLAMLRKSEGHEDRG